MAVGTSSAVMHKNRKSNKKRKATLQSTADAATKTITTTEIAAMKEKATGKTAATEAAEAAAAASTKNDKKHQK